MTQIIINSRLRESYGERKPHSDENLDTNNHLIVHSWLWLHCPKKWSTVRGQLGSFAITAKRLSNIYLPQSTQLNHRRILSSAHNAQKLSLFLLPHLPNPLLRPNHRPILRRVEVEGSDRMKDRSRLNIMKWWASVHRRLRVRSNRRTEGLH